ncbi:MAG: hypothetical protein WCE79_10295 [Xanthobacteraceae bacterium]
MPLPDWAAGKVFGYPCNEEKFLHSVDEWSGTLRSVLEARTSLVAIELGAGWGPWLVAAHAAARARGIDDIRLIGVEGMAEHIAMMRQHFIDNGIEASRHRIVHGIVGVRDGKAYFPKAKDATIEWGGEAIFSKVQPPDTVALPSVSLPTLMADFQRVDIVHCDIQGAEGEVLPAALPEMTKKVRRIVVGTHSRGIEHTLFGAFLAHGWKLEAEAACTFNIIEGRHYSKDDGTQVWANPQFDAPAVDVSGADSQWGTRGPSKWLRLFGGRRA